MSHNDLKKEILVVMMDNITHEEFRHDVAADFSNTELDKFIGTYLNYGSK